MNRERGLGEVLSPYPNIKYTTPPDTVKSNFRVPFAATNRPIATDSIERRPVVL
jgi:hypothetical protein